MSDGMRVDLSALDEVIRRLWALLDQMDEVGKKSTYGTNIPLSAFGSDHRFKEARDLFDAHNDTKADLETAIASLHRLINQFGKSTSKVRDKYSEQEYANEQQYGGGDKGPGKKFES
ncbi:hypothetical protein J7E91_28525 [Streptomyces sp. ISL-99]|uniref:hypothetical protein n=1 Tax=Streptomyces sp. ISL-99 TaxID=2819193 RepID=UPI001BE550C9|nr:hypothetical protein [Streptomyces sp. ISL-99]MBT2529243.1 hypothetical protein [Streptomyces sp. ISL-99]